MTADVVEDLPFTKEQLADQWWRLNHLYTYTEKAGGPRKPFVPNDEQTSMFQRWWPCFVNLKARQIGSTTFLIIVALDLCLFSDNFKAGIIAQGWTEGIALFKDKVRDVYDNMPQAIRQAVPLVTENKTELQFGNGSGIKIGVSMRGGTLQYLLITEFGKVAAKNPALAREIITGAMNTVAAGQTIIVESTSEGAGGAFFDLVQQARALAQQGKPLTPLDFRFNFYPWWRRPEYSIDPAGVILTANDHRYFDELEATITTAPGEYLVLTAGQKAWYVKKAETQKGDMKREFPSCVAGSEPVFSPVGITRMDAVPVDGSVVRAFYPKGEREVFRLVTDLGYEVTCTDDHPIKTPAGFVKLRDLVVGGEVVIGTAVTDVAKSQVVAYSPLPMVTSTISISADFGEFLGFFMGDGSYHDRTLSIACDGSDVDVVERVTALVTKFVGEPGTRTLGSNGGCTEVRIARGRLVEPFDAMGLLRRNASGDVKRNVHVPECIKRSPLAVSAAFLRGLFEADGFAQRNGSGVKFFSKYLAFTRDVQLELLRHGISCRRSRHDKVSGSGGVYEGWELSLRGNEAIAFAERIGFVSARKQARVSTRKAVAAHYLARRMAIATTAKIASIEPAGRAEVFDITTETHEFSAGGIVVHNCPDEAFEVAVEGAYYSKELQVVRKRGQVGNFPWIPTVPVNTFWDLGGSIGNATSIWFHQYINRRDRMIGFYEAEGEGMAHFVKYLQDTGYIFGKHYLPHDGAAQLQGDFRESRQEILERLHVRNIDIVPRVRDIGTGIELTRAALVITDFHEEECSRGLAALGAYTKTWNQSRGVWNEQPFHNWASNPADAFRQYAQAYESLSRIGGVVAVKNHNLDVYETEARKQKKQARSRSYRAV